MCVDAVGYGHWSSQGRDFRPPRDSLWSDSDMSNVLPSPQTPGSSTAMRPPSLVSTPPLELPWSSRFRRFMNQLNMVTITNLWVRIIQWYRKGLRVGLITHHVSLPPECCGPVVHKRPVTFSDCFCFGTLGRTWLLTGARMGRGGVRAHGSEENKQLGLNFANAVSMICTQH